MQGHVGHMRYIRGRSNAGGRGWGRGGVRNTVQLSFTILFFSPHWLFIAIDDILNFIQMLVLLK